MSPTSEIMDDLGGEGVTCNYCSDLYTSFDNMEAQLKAAGACPVGAIEDTDAAGRRVCKMWVDGRMWFVPRE